MHHSTLAVIQWVKSDTELQIKGYTIASVYKHECCLPRGFNTNLVLTLFCTNMMNSWLPGGESFLVLFF